MCMETDKQANKQTHTQGVEIIDWAWEGIGLKLTRDILTRLVLLSLQRKEPDNQV